MISGRIPSSYIVIKYIFHMGTFNLSFVPLFSYLHDFDWIHEGIPCQPFDLVLEGGTKQTTLTVRPDVVTNRSHLKVHTTKISCAINSF